MTQNQIAYKNALEVKRHNIMTEQEARRHAQAEEELKQWANQLSSWSTQVAKEHYERQDAINNAHYLRIDQLSREQLQLSRDQLEESKRSNLAGEDIQKERNKLQGISNAFQALQIEETKRSNLASESIREQQNAINAASVQEQQRHALIQEGIDKSLASSQISRQEAEVSYVNANTGLVQAKTVTEGNRPTEQAASINLIKSQTQTETSKRSNLKSQTLKNYVSSWKDVFGAGMDALGQVLVYTGL